MEVHSTPINYLPTSLSRPVQKPPAFDGRASWEAYLTQFEIVSDINKWGDSDALEVSLEVESFTLAAKRRARPVRVVQRHPTGEEQNSTENNLAWRYREV